MLSSLRPRHVGLLKLTFHGADIQGRKLHTGYYMKKIKFNIGLLSYAYDPISSKVGLMLDMI